MKYIFPSIQLATCIGASLVYLWQGDLRHGVYWFCAGVITVTVTF